MFKFKKLLSVALLSVLLIRMIPTALASYYRGYTNVNNYAKTTVFQDVFQKNGADILSLNNINVPVGRLDVNLLNSNKVSNVLNDGRFAPEIKLYIEEKANEVNSETDENTQLTIFLQDLMDMQPDKWGVQ